MDMVYSILLLVGLVFLFFWVLQGHKKTQREAYTNKVTNDMIQKYQNATITDADRDALCEMAAAASGSKITKEECINLLDTHGNIAGAVEIFKTFMTN